MLNRYFTATILLCSLLYSSQTDGKKVFETYCWGCHHQTAEAFGPSFSEIASKRSYEEIQAYIIDPESMYKAFGYKRTVMTKVETTQAQREAVAKYVLSFKGK
ncbi:MAG: cytochrome c [Sulfurimonas sp.]|uniref:c-type cytochrome n=1 Tax=Sulfurimonas sp. TaxID=2022749 RepID=UPI002624FE94|nr:cytochrome c [Sulfurimonas sp.]MCW8895425.1 cytochrome c [Sulfurimonas sp.]MCW8953856.1 cytochrome c [Sulfurimonas sp.]MCW9066825.1 cytochrome c [Sulfurimonas sp.]